MPPSDAAASTSPLPVDPASPEVPEAAVERIRALFAGAVEQQRTAGITWAVIGGHGHDRDVLAAGAAGDAELRDGHPAPGSRPMDTGTISRIASMTKSFAAASILRLRDEGRLRLDDRIEEHLPEAAQLLDGPAGEVPITLRALLTMSAGLVTDNPWGDRQEEMTRAQFAALLSAGLGHVRVPGTGFEYSNTGYALLGRVIDDVAGRPYAEDITEAWLRPLGMVDSAFRAEDVDRERLAIGHRIADRTDRTRFEALPFSGPGVYGAMAGLFSTTADIARWARFLAAADAPATGGGTSAALLSAASRREMQQIHRIQALPPLPPGPDGTSAGFDRVRGYGFGLVVERWPDLGEIVSHSGGYPGYGSFMCWHRDSGVGIVALANAKYAPASVLSMQAMRVLAAETPLLAPRCPEPSARTREAASAGLAWLRAPDDAVADAWFADSMDLDVPREERRRRREAALQATGLPPEALASLTVDDGEAITPAHVRWTLHAADPARGALRIDAITDPRRAALLQALDLTVLDGSVED